MSEQKYYVKLKKEFQATGVTFADMRLYLYKSGAFDYGYNGYHFTKSELAEIKDGAFYKQTWALPFEWLSNSTSLKEGLGWEYNETIDKFEYTNPLIELVPVEEK